VYAAWQGDGGGRDPETAYRRYIERGLTAPPENPVRDATQGWLPGSSEFVFGLGRADSARKRTRRVNRALPDSSRLRQDIAAIRQELLNRSQKRFSKSPKSNLDRMLGSGSSNTSITPG